MFLVKENSQVDIKLYFFETLQGSCNNFLLEKYFTMFKIQPTELQISQTIQETLLKDFI